MVLDYYFFSTITNKLVKYRKLNHDLSNIYLLEFDGYCSRNGLCGSGYALYTDCTKIDMICQNNWKSADNNTLYFAVLSALLKGLNTAYEYKIKNIVLSTKHHYLLKMFETNKVMVNHNLNYVQYLCRQMLNKFDTVDYIYDKNKINMSVYYLAKMVTYK